MATISNKDIYDAIQVLREEVQNNYVTKDAFDPVKRIVYGLVALMLTAVVGTLIAIVVKDPTVITAITTSNKE